VEVLAAYTDFLRENPEEVLPRLDTILRAALRHGLNVDELLEAFAEQGLQAVKLAHRSGNDSYFTRSLAIFELLRDWATAEQVREVQGMIKER
jgi:hypothetical protein